MKVKLYYKSREGFAFKGSRMYKPIGNNIWGHKNFFHIKSSCDWNADKSALTNQVDCLVYFVDHEFTYEEYEEEIKSHKEFGWNLLIDEIVADG